MPLKQGTSQQTVSGNISEMVHAGHSQRQAVAAAMRQKRESEDQMSGTTTPSAVPAPTPAPTAAPTPTAGVSPSLTTAPPVTPPAPTATPIATPTAATPDADDPRSAGPPPNWANDSRPVLLARDQARMAGNRDDWSPEAREAAAKARAAHSGGGGGGPEGHQQLHQKLTASGHQHKETPTHHIWSKSNTSGGTETRVSKASGPTNKEPEGAKPWYHKVEAEHGKSREGPGGSRITGSGFQQRQWQAPKG